MTITFVTGEGKVIVISPVKSVSNNLLLMILRESGRFIIRDDNEFIALSEKKVRTFGISGTIGASSTAEHNHSYDTVPNADSTIFSSAEMFPQDLVDEYKVNQLEIYGIAVILDMSLTDEPSDAVGRLKGSHMNYWITRQPQTSFSAEDCIGASFSAFQSTPENGLISIVEGVMKTTVKKKLVPGFIPVKSSFLVDKLKDKIYVYNDVEVLGYCGASILGGNFTGTAVFDHRLIVGQGFLPEEVEELLSPSQ